MGLVKPPSTLERGWEITFHKVSVMTYPYKDKTHYCFVIASNNPYHWIHFCNCRNYATTWNFSYIQESQIGNRHIRQIHVSWYRMAQQKGFVMSNTSGKVWDPQLVYELFTNAHNKFNGEEHLKWIADPFSINWLRLGDAYVCTWIINYEQNSVML